MTDDATGANGPPLPEEPRNRSERRLRRLAAKHGLKLQRSRMRDPQNLDRPWWLVAGHVGVILRDARLQEIEAFFSAPAETRQVAIDIAEATETMARYTAADVDWSRRFDLATRIQSVLQDVLACAPLGASELAPLLAAIRSAIGRSGLSQEAA